MLVDFIHDSEGVLLYINKEYKGKFYSERDAWDFMVLNSLIPNTIIKRVIGN